MVKIYLRIRLSSFSMSVKMADNLSFTSREAFMASMSQSERNMFCWLFARGGYASLQELKRRVTSGVSDVAYRLQRRGLVEFYDKKRKRVVSKENEFITLRCSRPPGHDLDASSDSCRFEDSRYGLSFFNSLGVSPVDTWERKYDPDMMETSSLKIYLELGIISQEEFDKAIGGREKYVIHFARFRRADLLRVIDFLKEEGYTEEPEEARRKGLLLEEYYPLVSFLSLWEIDDRAHAVRDDMEIFSVPDRFFDDPGLVYVRSWGRHSHVGRPSRYVCLTPEALSLAKRFSMQGSSGFDYRVGYFYARRFVFSRVIDEVGKFCDYFTRKYGFKWVRVGGDDPEMRSEYFRRIGKSVGSLSMSWSGKSKGVGIRFGAVAKVYGRDFAFKVFGLLGTLIEIKKGLEDLQRSHPYFPVDLEIGRLRKMSRRGDVEAANRLMDMLAEESEERSSYEGLLRDVTTNLGSFPFTIQDVFTYVLSWYRRCLLFRWFSWSDSHGRNRIYWYVLRDLIEFIKRATCEYNLLFCFCPSRLEAFERYGIEVATRSKVLRSARLPGGYWRYV